MLTLSFDSVRAFSRAASMHLEASMALLTHCPKRSNSVLAAEVIYLSGYVAECGLKALLLSHTPPKEHRRTIERFKNPKEFGHDLERLRLELHTIGVRLPLPQKEQLRRIRSGGWTPPMRYDPRPRSHGDAERVVLAAEGFQKWMLGR